MFLKFLAYLSILFFIVIIIFHSIILENAQIYRKAIKDYYSSRGKKQLKKINHCLKILEKQRIKLKTEIVQLKTEIDIANMQMNDELVQALSNHIINENFYKTNIPKNIIERIVYQCFEGTLNSLRYAENVSGVGPVRMEAICKWIDKWESRMPDLLAGDFPNKTKIIKKFTEKENSLKDKLFKANESIAEIDYIEEYAKAAKEQLSKVKIVHFINAYKQNIKAMQKTNILLRGLFFEWELVPEWFAKLTSKYCK